MRNLVWSFDLLTCLPPSCQSIPMSEFTSEWRGVQMNPALLRAALLKSSRRKRNLAEAMFEKLTLKSVDVRAVLVPLRRPVVSKVGLFKDWPLILIDLYTNEGVVGRRLPGALPQERRPLRRARNSRLGGRADGKIARTAGQLPERSTVVESAWLRRCRNDRRVGSGHGDLGCARKGGRDAAGGAA